MQQIIIDSYDSGINVCIKRMRKYRCAYVGFLVDLNPKELVVEWVDHDKDIGKLCPEDGSTIVPPVLAPDDVHLIIPQMSDLNEELGALETFLEALPREHQANCETIAKKNPVRNSPGHLFGASGESKEGQLPSNWFAQRDHVSRY